MYKNNTLRKQCAYIKFNIVSIYDRSMLPYFLGRNTLHMRGIQLQLMYRKERYHSGTKISNSVEGLNKFSLSFFFLTIENTCT